MGDKVGGGDQEKLCSAGISDDVSKEQLRKQQAGDEPEHPVRTGQRQPP